MCLDRRAGHLSDWTDRQILRRCQALPAHRKSNIRRFGLRARLCADLRQAAPFGVLFYFIRPSLGFHLRILRKQKGARRQRRGENQRCGAAGCAAEALRRLRSTAIASAHKGTDEVCGGLPVRRSAPARTSAPAHLRPRAQTGAPFPAGTRGVPRGHGTGRRLFDHLQFF